MPNEKASRVRLTSGRIEALNCPPGKSQVFLWDTEAPALLVRATPTGRKTYAFEARLNGKTMRIQIGAVTDWTIAAARQRATSLKQLVDCGIDPRAAELQAQTEEAERLRQQAEAAQREAVTVGQAWNAYVEARSSSWGTRHLADHQKLVAPGGQVAKRGKKGGGLTVAGPLHSLAVLRLSQIDSATLKTWAKREAT